MPNSPSEPRWLTAEDLVSANAVLVAETGEPHIVRDPGLLESACSVPMNRWAYEPETDLGALAASLLVAVARNHPFMQGNKRTAFAAAILFMRLNGANISSRWDSVEIAEAIVAVLTGVSDEAALAQRLRAAARTP